MGFGENLKRYRKSKNLTQQELADILKIKRSTYATYESGRIGVSTDLLQKLSKHFNTTIDNLLKEIKQQGFDDDKSVSTKTSEEEVPYKLGEKKGNDETFFEKYISQLQEFNEVLKKQLDLANSRSDKLIDAIYNLSKEDNKKSTGATSM